MSRIKNSIVAFIFAALSWVCFALPASAQFADQGTYAGVAGGTGNAQTITIPNVTSMADVLGVIIKFTPVANNTTAATLNINSIGAVAIDKTSSGGPTALTGGELVGGGSAQAVAGMWDGSHFLLMSNFNAAPTSVFPQPQGYLTPCSATVGVSGCPTVGTTANAGGLVPTGDVTSATTLYYQPDQGNQIPIWNGSAMIPKQFSELALTLGSSNVANTLYDVCVTTTTAGVYDVNGTPTLVTSVAWSSSTLGSGTRGTGGGTAQISRINGVWTNAVVISGLNGATTYTNIPANTCTIVATIFIDGTNGQATFNRTYGQNRRWAVWNFYNRLPLYMKVGDSTASWNPTTTLGPVNANAANSAKVVIGLQEESVTANAFEVASYNVAAANGAALKSGIGLNVTNAASGFLYFIAVGSGTAGINGDLSSSSQFITLPLLGAETFTFLEYGGNPVTVSGGEGNNVMTLQWRG